MAVGSLALAAAALASHALLVSASSSRDNEVLIFEDTFDKFNMSVWKHEITLSGEGNWEFEYYLNNRSNSFVRNGVLTIMPTYVNSTFNVQNADVNIWGGDPSSACTDNGFFGCERQGGAGGNIVNPIQSARIRTAESFAFKYGRVEVVAKLPRGE
jgi:beta-glucanase (GH16 family)